MKIVKYIISSKAICLVTLVIMMSYMNLSANSQQTKPALISLNMSDAMIKDVFKYIERNSEYGFFFSDNVNPELNKKVSIKATDKTIEQVLADLLVNTDLTYKLNGRQVIISFNAEKPKSVKKTIINGTTLDEQNNPLVGVNISVKGLAKGTVSDMDGRYYIEVPNKKSILVFQYIGFEAKEIEVGSQININVNLLEVSTGLNETVVIGYGSQKKISVVGSITTIEPKQLQIGTGRSMTNNLAGQLAGVIGVQRSGEPGYDNSSFWIRGISTFQGNRSPLVLVDGIERSLNDLDPAEIESFSILKDAAASAVYGVRGANGVFLVNTKRGKLGKPTINLRFEQGFTQPVKLPEFIGSADYLDVLNSISREAGLDEFYSQEKIDNYRNNTDPDLYPNVNWLDAITKDYASNSRTNLTVSGGSNILRYSIVASMYGEEGIMDRDKTQAWNSTSTLSRYNIRSNVDVDLTPTTLLRVNIGGYLQEQKRAPQSVDNLFNLAFETTPFLYPTKYSSGEIPVVPQRSNPWALATQTGYEKSNASKIESLFSVEQDLKFILPGLKAKGIFSFDRYSRSTVTRSKSPMYYNPATSRNEDGSLNLVIYQDGQEFLGYNPTSEWGNKSTYLEGNMSYSQNFGENYLDLMFLYNQRDYDDGSKLPFRNQGIAARASYRYSQRYIAEFNFGYNGSENFAKGKRFGFFPSVAVGWLMSEEEFMASVKETLSKVKFRASYGSVGNDKLDGRRFSYLTTIAQTNGYTWGMENNYFRDGYREGDYGIPNLTWETVNKANLGLELGLWNDLDLQVDLFKEQHKDIFMKRSTIPTATGFIEMPWANYGRVDNQGVEVSLNYNKQMNKDLTIGLRGTFTYAKNKIIEFDEPLGIQGTNRTREGLPVGQIFGLIAEGLFTEDDFEDVNAGTLKEGIPAHTLVTTIRPGDIKYKDVNGDGSITSMDESPIGGTVDPQLVYGFGASVRYKNLDLNCFLQGNGKTWRVIGGDNFIPGSGSGAMGNILTNVNDRWTVENPSQNVFWPRLDSKLNANNKYASTWWLRDMSMLRLKDVEIGYSFPTKWTKKWGMSNARIFGRGANLLTVSDFKLWDPELDTSNGCRYPIMKSLSFGLDIKF